MRFLTLLIVLTLTAAHVAQAQDNTAVPVVVTVFVVWPTEPPTVTPTEGPSPTPTPSPTSTPDYVAESTVEANGMAQDVAFRYEASAGDVMQSILLLAIAGLIVLDMLLRVKK